MSYNHNDPSYIQFVKADDDLCGAPSSSTCENKREHLDGTDIANFYRCLTMEPSTSVKEKPRVVEKRSMPRIKATMKPPRSTEPLTPRDQRLWFKAAAEDDLSAVKEYHKRGMNLEELDFFGASALVCAAARGALNVVEYLLLSGAHPSAPAVAMAERMKFSAIAAYISSFQRPKLFNPANEPKQSGSCDDCRHNYTDLNAHRCSISHIVNSKEGPRPGYAYGIPMSNKGYQLLKDTGWSEGSGLGSDGIGRKYPLKTMLKRDRRGLGSQRYALKVTHFDAHDKSAVQKGFVTKKPVKREYFKQLEERKMRDRKIDETIRNALRD